MSTPRILITLILAAACAFGGQRSARWVGDGSVVSGGDAGATATQYGGTQIDLRYVGADPNANCKIVSAGRGNFGMENLTLMDTTDGTTCMVLFTAWHPKGSISGAHFGRRIGVEMPLKKQPNYNYQTYSQAMATVAQLQKLGIPVEQVMEVDPGALVSTPDSQSGVACYAPTDPDFVPDANLHQYSAKVWGGVRQELGLLQQQLDGHTGRDGVLGLAQQCFGDPLKALSAVWDLPAIVAVTEPALKA